MAPARVRRFEAVTIIPAAEARERFRAASKLALLSEGLRAIMPQEGI
jgi:hypothetical protein